MSELEEFVKNQLELHSKIMALVKPYVDTLFKEYNIKLDSPETRNTYLAMVLELTRSIFINWSYEQRQRSMKFKVRR